MIKKQISRKQTWIENQVRRCTAVDYRAERQFVGGKDTGNTRHQPSLSIAPLFAAQI